MQLPHLVSSTNWSSCIPQLQYYGEVRKFEFFISQFEVVPSNALSCKSSVTLARFASHFVLSSFIDKEFKHIIIMY